MSGSLYLSTSGAEARLQQIDALSNNLANSGTAGFRATEVSFEGALEAALLEGEAGGGRSFVAADLSSLRLEPGPVEQTGRALDVAIQGEGYFIIETPEGIRHTRAGSFHVDPQGFLATHSGHPVLGNGGPIQVGQRPATIQADGAVIDDEGTVLGRLRLEQFLEPAEIQREGGNLLRVSEDTVVFPVDGPAFAPASIEGSNVRTVQELARLVIVQRAFDASMRTLEAEDAASSRLLQEI